MTTPDLLAPPTSLVDVAQVLVAHDKGPLPIDESIGTCSNRLGRLGIGQDEPTRRAYWELIVTTPGLAEYISGVIPFDETIRQHTTDGTPFLTVLADAEIIPGIKVDLGARPIAGHPGEKTTEGLDGLRERLAESGDLASARLNAIDTDRSRLPWPVSVSVSFGRAHNTRARRQSPTSSRQRPHEH